MAFRPFGKELGPSMNARPSVVRPSFGSRPQSSSPTTPPPPMSGPQIQRAPSPPSAFQNNFPSFRPHQPSEVQRGPEHGGATPSPPLALNHSEPFGKSYQNNGIQRGSEASKKSFAPTLAFQGPNDPVRPNQYSGIKRPVQAPYSLGDRPSSLNESGGQSHPSPSARQSYVVSRNVGINAAEIGPFRGRNIDKSPPLLSADDVSRNSQPPNSQRSSAFPARKRSPQSAFGNNQYGDDFCPPSTQTRRQSPSSMENRTARFTGNFPYQSTHQDQPPNSSYIDSYDADFPVLGTKKSFPVAPSNSVYQDISTAGQYNFKRPSISPPALRTGANVSSHNSQVIEKPVTHANDRLGPTSRSTSSTPKTIRSSLLSAEVDILGNSGSSQDGTEREDQAKAKRLARFKGELGSLPTRAVDIADKKLSINKTSKPFKDKHKVPSVEPNREMIKLDTMSDSERLEPPSVITGLCPDMCPESEREERERKGDLDKYERVDGDRNQTSKYLAVKKYTRTAERESILIRPLPVLQETIDYLLDLLDQPYDDSFLGLYNFLWDRMRAIRMDLRMQHIFNEEAITMLEKMIRLHIIAMHELCEYTKGEGFAEGFDAHLNIEQMNKTSVELFQLYDDHRKRGIAIPTEQEFRGYYALLKLDKHPGYKVEPAELSLDLARMTPEIRQTPEVLFARNVARACRTGNFIAFFRLAKRASYLQACLMHAHFAKLRTQALASLHSGLLNNQGLPVSDVSKWIGMEEENIETLLDYHGYSVKEFEEPYIVKDGPFLNADKDYPTRCSRLVHLKKLRTIVEDVSPSSPLLPLLSETRKDTTQQNLNKHDPLAIPDLKKQTSFRAMDEDIPCSRTPSPKVDKQQAPLTVKPMVEQHHDDQQKVDKILSPKYPCSPRGSPRFSPATVRSMEQPNKNSRFSQAETKSIGIPNNIIKFHTFPEENKLPGAQAMPTETATEPAMQQSFSKTMPIEIMPKALVHESPQRREDEYSLMESGAQRKKDDFEDEKLLEMDVEKEDDNGTITSQHDKEVAEAKLKLIIRLWKRWSSRQREFHEQRQLAASAALNSLSLGPPIRLSKDDQPSESGHFDIDHAMRTRSEKHEQSWSRVNVSNVTVDTLSEKNPDSKCLCWKIVLCSPMDSVKMGSQASSSSARQWLLSKLMPSKENEDVDQDLLLSSPGMSIWSKWVPRRSSSDLICCLSVVRHLKVDSDLHDTVSGASGVLFLVSGNVPWRLQKNQLNNLLKAIPPGSCLPLLIISDSYNGDCSEPTSAIVNELDLHHIDKAKVSSFSVLSLIDDCEKGKADNFFSDKQLRGGLQWLAGNSPLQPVLHCHRPRELLLNTLSASLNLLGKMPSNEVGPNLCISAFNEALDHVLRKMTSAIESNPVSWPCPEIELLEGSGNEHLMVKWHLPIIGWSSAERTEPLKSLLKNLKIPAFHDNLTWLTIGCGTGSELENQRTRLERCLIEYLSETGKLMEDTLAAKEAFVMLQRNTKLELQNSSYYLVPNWVVIFRRIFNWRLIGLSDTAFSSVYILKSDLDASTLWYTDKLVVDDDLCMSYSPTLPSLDEMIGIGFQAEPNSFKPLPIPLLYDGAQETANSIELIDDRQDEMAVVGDDDYEMASATHELECGKDKEEVERRASSEADRLRELLEKCNIVQNKIAEKLSFYF